MRWRWVSAASRSILVPKNRCRSREETRRGEAAVNGADLEQKFTCLLHAVRRKAKLSSKAKCLIEIFNEEQRRVLYTLLDKIEEQRALPHKLPMT
jgi:hypothetical protein